MNFLDFSKVSNTPVTIDPNTVYLIPDAVDGFLNIAVSNKTGDKVLKTLSTADVDAIATNKVTEILSQNPGVVVRVINFDATTELVIEHNLNTLHYSYTIVNSDGMTVWSAGDSNIDLNHFTVNFTEAEAGTISVLFYVNT